MKRLSALFLCLFLLVQFAPAYGGIEDWVADINGISAKVLEWCMMEHETEMTLTLPKSAIRGLTDSEIQTAVFDALDEYCTEDYKVYRNTTSDGGMKVRITNISLRPGLLIAEAYWDGKTDRLNADEKKCLRQLTSITDGFVRQYGYATLDTELAIYDYICEHVEYRTYPSGDSRRKQCTSAANALLYGWGNCQAYSDLFFVMTMMTGFDTGFISGEANGSPHLWNTISIGGEEFMVDVTYGDNGDNYYPLPNHYFFNFGQDRLYTHTWSKEVLNPNYLARKTNDTYSYYNGKNNRYGKIVDDLDSAARYCVSQINKGIKYTEVLVKMTVRDSNAMNTAIKKALGSTQAEWTFNYYSYDGNFLVLFNWKQYRNKNVSHAKLRIHPVSEAFYGMLS